MINLSDSPKRIMIGHKVCQFTLHKMNEFKIKIEDEISETERGEKGLGSSGE
jgi:dUTPase